MAKAVIFDMFETLITHYESPLYFGDQMAEDAGIPREKFQEMWHAAEDDRTIGKITLEEILEKILRTNNCFSADKVELIVNKRIRCKEAAFRQLHSEIVPLLQELKKRGVLVGLISNCFSEEATVIKSSALYPFFDAVCLSFEEGLQKPDPAIYKSCLQKLGVSADVCLYVGDGGSDELEAAELLGMTALQATWYFKAECGHFSRVKTEFQQLKTPLEVLQFI